MPFPNCRLPSQSLLFIPNTGHYMPKYPCSSPNGLVFNKNSSSGYVHVSAAPSGRCVCVCVGGGLLHAQSALRETSGSGGFKWVSFHRVAQNYLDARNLLCQSQS